MMNSKQDRRYLYFFYCSETVSNMCGKLFSCYVCAMIATADEYQHCIQIFKFLSKLVCLQVSWVGDHIFLSKYSRYSGSNMATSSVNQVKFYSKLICGGFWSRKSIFFCQKQLQPNSCEKRVQMLIENRQVFLRSHILNLLENNLDQTKLFFSISVHFNKKITMGLGYNR